MHVQRVASWSDYYLFFGLKDNDDGRSSRGQQLPTVFIMVKVAFFGLVFVWAGYLFELDERSHGKMMHAHHVNANKCIVCPRCQKINYI